LKAAPADRKTACRTTHLDAFPRLIDSVTGGRFGSPNNVLSSPLFGQSTQTPANCLAGGDFFPMFFANLNLLHSRKIGFCVFHA
jgi:hypothetical protein